jgi:ComF family protein
VSATGWFTELLHGTLDLVFAPVCTVCASPIPSTAKQRLVCSPCWSRMRPIPDPRCPRCWTPRLTGAAADAGCATCKELPGSIRVVRSAYVMSGPARELEHALKYRGWHAIAELMAERMALLSLPDDVVDEASIVVPVPTTPARLRERGYNQAELIARSFARRTGRELQADRLRRGRSAKSQTALHPSERRANVAGAFSASPAARAGMSGEHVLLIDDVWTTGATAIECAQTLLRGGVRAVSVVTFARALPELDRETRL